MGGNAGQNCGLSWGPGNLREGTAKQNFGNQPYGVQIHRVQEILRS